MDIMRILRRLIIGPYRPLRRPSFAANDELLARQRRAAQSLPPNSVRPLIGREGGQ